MLKLVGDEVPEEATHTLDPLQSCVDAVLEFHHRRIDLISIVSEIPTAKERWNIATLPLVAERLDFSLKIIECTIDQLRGTRVPVILPLKNKLFAVVQPDGQGTALYLHPGKAPQPFNEKHVSRWHTKRVIVMTPKSALTATATDHMHVDRSIDWFWQPIKKFTPNFVEVLVCTVFINCLVIALPLFTLNVYDSVVPNLAMSSLTVLGIGVAIAIVFDVLLKSARASTLERIAARTGVQFDGVLMQQMLSVKHEELQLSVGERCNLFRELKSLRDFYATQLVPALVDFPFFLLFLFVIYLISPMLTLVPIAIAVSILLLNAMVHIPVTRSTKTLFSSTQEKSSMMVEMLSGTSTIKQLNATGETINRWNLLADQVAEASRQNQRWMSWGQHGSLGLMQLNHVLVVVVGVYQIQSGVLTIGGLVASTILASRTIAPVMNFHGVIARWVQSRDCLKTIDDLFMRDTDMANSQVVPVKPLRGSLALNNFSYSYPNQTRPAVKDINLTIEAGESICLIGPSGAGKSTLAKAIVGAIVATEGQLTIDGLDYKALSAARLRDSMAVIPQDPFFVSGTVRENLLLGIAHCSESQLNKATTMSGLDLVLASTGRGLDTNIGENGRFLSGGQKQAISIARAILRDSQLLVFDEPTNSLDSVLERQFMQTMQPYARHRTLIMVTHKMSLLSLADRVIIMDKGQIVADESKEAAMRRFAA